MITYSEEIAFRKQYLRWYFQEVAGNKTTVIKNWLLEMKSSSGQLDVLKSYWLQKSNCFKEAAALIVQRISRGIFQKSSCFTK